MKEANLIKGLIIIVFILIPLFIIGKKTSFKFKAPASQYTRKSDKRQLPQPIEPDSTLLLKMIPKITFSGYDKPASSRIETFLITNDSEQHISGLEFNITYKDLQDRMLHSRSEEIVIDIPPGETRQAEIKSFDKQQTYYFYRSSAPKGRTGQPFCVEINLLQIKVPR